ncbi:unnamed protein product [Rhizophagus irregularis]|nr:unnamed protein product [Rhizophagus irregularis]
MEGKLEFVPYEQFKNVEFIAEGGFSKIYKATWIDGPIKSYRNYNSKKEIRLNNYTVVLKKLNNSKSITSKELNELKIFYNFSSKWKAWIGYNSHISKYFGITQDPITQDTTIIMPYYDSGYTGLMKECDPKRRPNATSICNKIDKMYMKEWNNRNKNPTKIIKSPDIGPVIINNPSATYKSRSLSGMINSAISLRSSRSQSISSESIKSSKRKLENNLGQSTKRKKSSDNDTRYITKELDFDINCATLN